ncbi:CHAT domain-containing protein [Planctomycetes bacterium K23_9]|uniref:CHAT domain protein n=1 Tax=Stieleria marina TaxID=1930275 RepID=A0A517NM13_9BACT|nr:CHAT domain protein [Planctomycetes bacterium K23_9]
MNASSRPSKICITMVALSIVILSTSVLRSTKVGADEGDPTIDVPTIAQSRAILSRDLIWNDCRDALLAKDWAKLLQLGQQAQRLEKIAFGDSFAGNKLTHFMLLNAYNNLGQESDASKLWKLVYDSGNGQSTRIVDGNGPVSRGMAVEARKRLTDLTYTIARFNSDRDITDRFAQIIESYDWFAKQLAIEAVRDGSGIVRMPPNLSMLRAYVFLVDGDAEKAIEVSRQAFQQLKREMPDTWWKAMEDDGGANIAGYTASILVTRAKVAERNADWDAALSFREEAQAIAIRLSDENAGLKRDLDVCRAIVSLSADEKNDYQTLNAKRQEAIQLASVRSFPAAIKLGKDILPKWEKLFGDQSDTTAMIYRRMGYWSWTQGSYRQAIEHLITASDVFMQTRARRDDWLCGAVNDVFINLDHLGSSDQISPSVIKPVQDFLVRLKARFGNDHPMVLDGQISLAGFQRRLALSATERSELAKAMPLKYRADQSYSTGNYTDSLQWAQKFLAQSDALLGTQDVIVHDAQSMVANVMVELGRHVEAATVYEELFRRTDKRPYNQTARHAGRLQWRAGNLAALAKIDQALECISDAKECCQRTLGPKSERFVHCLRIEARILKDGLRKPAKAYPLLTDALEKLTYIYNGQDGFEICQTMVDLADCETQLGYFDESEKHLKTALEIRERNQFNNGQMTCWNHFQRGYNAFEAQRFDEAVEHYQSALELKKKIDPTGGDLPNLYGCLVASCTWTDNHDHSPWVKQFLAHAGAQYKTDTPEYADAILKMLRPLTVPPHGDAMGQLNHARAEVIHTLAAQTLSVLELNGPSEIGLHVIALQYVAEAEIFQQNFTSAISRLHRAIDLAEQDQGNESLLFARVNATIAKAYRLRGDLPQALRHGDLCLRIFQNEMADDSLAVANLSLRHADLLSAMGDFDRAEALVVNAENAMAEAGIGQRSQSMLQLAELYLRMGKTDLAELWLHRGRLLSDDKSVGDEVDTRILQLLTRLYLIQSESNAALPIAKDVLKRCKTETPNRELLIGAHHLLGEALLAKGSYMDAERHLTQSLELSRGNATTSKGEKADAVANPAVSLQSLQWGTHRKLAQLCQLCDRVAEAENWLTLGVVSALTDEQRFASVLSENQQLSLRMATDQAMHAYLGFALQQNLAAEKVHRYVLQWKGAVFMQQARLRKASRSHNPETIAVSRQLEGVNRELASRVFAARNAIDQTKALDRLTVLTQQKQRLESELALLTHTKLAEANWAATPTDWQQFIKPSEVLVDFVEFKRSDVIGDLTSDQSKCIVAFAIQGDSGAIAMIDLGPADKINHAISQWRGSFTPGSTIANRNGAELAGEHLATLLWQPLAPLVGNAKTVLISPDGRLSQLPFAAIPHTAKRGSLVQDHAFVTVPVPQWMIESKRKDARDQNNSLDAGKKILLVGDVDYAARFETSIAQQTTENAIAKNASPKQSNRIDSDKIAVTTKVKYAPRWANRSPTESNDWESLPGTRDEITSIASAAERCFPDVQVISLNRTAACEDAIRRMASKTRYLHLATHGFFAGQNTNSNGAVQPSGRQESLNSMSMLDGQTVPGLHPSFLTGVVLAGANQTPEMGQDDGILTAAEVTELDLVETELVVLSACETGLGEVQSGEGVVGLQRAFGLAGAKSILTSLWKVDDRATQVFMTTFYEKLWSEKMTKSAALQATQLEMIHRYQPQTGALRGDRRFELSDDAPIDDQPNDKGKNLSPFFWAAFTLSGDHE